MPEPPTVSLSLPGLAALMTRRRGGLNFVFASFACNQKPRFCRKRGFFCNDDGGHRNRIIPTPDAHHAIFYSGRVENLRPGYSFTLHPGVLGFTSTGTKVNIHRRAELLLGLFTSTRFHPFFNGTMEGSRKW